MSTRITSVGEEHDGSIESEYTITPPTPIPPIDSDSDHIPPYLPPEIYHHLFPFLADPEIAICLRVSWDFHLIGLPLLYGTLEIDLTKRYNPITTNGELIDSPEALLSDLNIEPFTDRISLPNRFA